MGDVVGADQAGRSLGAMVGRPDFVYVITIRVRPTDPLQPFGVAIARVVGVLKRAGHDVTVRVERQPTPE